MDVTEALKWASERKHAVVITLREDGRAQSSDVVYVVEDGALVVSVTDDRAKTRNMRRDRRIVVHVSEPASWSYVSFDGTVDLSPVTIDPSDATADALCTYYETVAGKPHPDWDEYRAAMVAEKRLLARFTPTSAVGQLN